VHQIVSLFSYCSFNSATIYFTPVNAQESYCRSTDSGKFYSQLTVIIQFTGILGYFGAPSFYSGIISLNIALLMPGQKISLNHNKQLAAIFRQMSDCYKYMGPEQRFRALAYETVSGS